MIGKGAIHSLCVGFVGVRNEVGDGDSGIISLLARVTGWFQVDREFAFVWSIRGSVERRDVAGEIREGLSEWRWKSRTVIQLALVE